MSGITGSCIVCGKFHATGHIGDDHILLEKDGAPVLACPDCIPFVPKYKKVGCACGNIGVELRWPEGTWGHGKQLEWTCETCKEAKRHKELHDHIERMK